MKKLFNIIFVLILFSSCEPDVASEGVNLPPIDFPFNIENDTAYLKLGDTLIVSTIISNILSDGSKITDGKASIKIGSSYSSEIPIVDGNSFKRAKNDYEFSYLITEGSILIQENSSNLYHLYAYPSKEDSIKITLYYIPLKKGTFSFDLSSLFYEGTIGKTRTNPFFNVINNNGEELWQVPNMPAIQPNDPAYNKHYYFAVTD